MRRGDGMNGWIGSVVVGRGQIGCHAVGRLDWAALVENFVAVDFGTHIVPAGWKRMMQLVSIDVRNFGWQRTDEASLPTRLVKQVYETWRWYGRLRLTWSTAASTTSCNGDKRWGLGE